VQAVNSNPVADLKIWDKVCIIVGEGREAGVYQTRIVDIINGGIVVMNLEFVSGHTLLRNNTPVVVQFTREDAAYQFHSRVRVQGAEETRRVLLSPPRGFRRVQRRMFARVDFTVRVSYTPLPVDSKWDVWLGGGVWTDTTSVDVSAGGLLVRLSSKATVGQLFAFQIRNFGKAGLPTTLIAICRRTFVRDGQSLAGFEFLLSNELNRYLSRSDLHHLPHEYKQFDQRTQDRLVTYLFHKQIELRQKGLI